MRTDRQQVEVGDLTPMRRLLAELDLWIEQDRLRGRTKEPAHTTLVQVRARLGTAVSDAANVELELDPASLAKLEGVTPSAIHKRHQRGTLPGARTSKGGRLRIVVGKVA